MQHLYFGNRYTVLRSNSSARVGDVCFARDKFAADTPEKVINKSTPSCATLVDYIAGLALNADHLQFILNYIAERLISCL